MLPNVTGTNTLRLLGGWGGRGGGERVALAYRFRLQRIVQSCCPNWCRVSVKVRVLIIMLKSRNPRVFAVDK